MMTRGLRACTDRRIGTSPLLRKAMALAPSRSIAPSALPISARCRSRLQRCSRCRVGTLVVMKDFQGFWAAPSSEQPQRTFCNIRLSARSRAHSFSFSLRSS
eukprot:scaffold8090_cov267-Pinguiococcus_pyrenoidosus.AAC.7